MFKGYELEIVLDALFHRFIFTKEEQWNAASAKSTAGTQINAQLIPSSRRQFVAGWEYSQSCS